MNRQVKFICEAVKWFDKVNGNTYHSVRITRCKDNKVITGQFQYGYGDQYRQTALNEMLENKWLPKKYGIKNKRYGGNLTHMYERENNYPILWNVTNGLKRNCIANGII